MDTENKQLIAAAKAPTMLQTLPVWANREDGKPTDSGLPQRQVEVTQLNAREALLSFDDETSHHRSQEIDSLVTKLSSEPSVRHVERSDREVVVVDSDLATEELEALVDRLFRTSE